MTINYTNLLGLAKPVTGTETGQWGDVVNDQITELIEDAVANASSISVTSGDVTLTTTTGSSNQARMAVLLITGSPGVSRNIIAPSQSKWYIVKNSSNASIVVKGSATTGVTILADTEALVFWNGSDFEVAGLVGPSSSTDNAVARFDSTTGKVIQNSGVTIDDSNNVSGVAQLNATTADLTNLEVTNIKAKDGTAAASIADSTGIISITSNPILSGGTANGVLYLNGSKVATSGSALVFDGTNLGVNVSPSASQGRVQVNGAGQSWFKFYDSTAGWNFGTFYKANGSTALGYIGSGGGNAIAGGTVDDLVLRAEGPLLFATNGGTERMRLDTSGNLRLGTTSSLSAADRLTVVGGNIAVQRTSGITTFMGDNTQDGYVGTVTNHAFAFLTNSTERMRLDSSGNLGLGVTPSAWGGSYKAIEFPGISVANLNGGTNQQAQYLLNAYDSGAGAWKYKITGVSAAMYRQSADGAHEWHRAGTGTAGNTISFTQAMTLDASGNLGLGVTPSAWVGKAIEIGPAANGFLFNDSNNVNLGANAYYNAGWKYQTSSVGASRYAQTSGAHIWYNAASGTAGNAISFTQAMTLDSSGNLGIGTSSPGAKVHAYDTSNSKLLSQTTTGYAQFQASSTSGDFHIVIDNSTGAGFGAGAYSRLLYSTGAYPMVFSTNATERARITSGGDFLIGTTSLYGTAGLSVIPNASAGAVNVYWNRTATSSTSTAATFSDGGTPVGTITYTNTAVAYNTTSDYRLKDNQQPLTGSGAFIDALQPKTWEWKTDGSRGVGFIAHEVQTVSPGSVVGTKDAVDEEGKPVMQAMEYGSAEFIANIIAELQSLRARVAALESKGA